MTTEGQKKSAVTPGLDKGEERAILLVCRRAGKTNTSATTTATTTATAAIDPGGVYHMSGSQTTNVRTHYTIPADHAYGFKTKDACSRRVEEVHFTRQEQRHRTSDVVRGKKLFHHNCLGKGASRDTIHSIYARRRQMSCGRKQQSRRLQGVCLLYSNYQTTR